jgi:hypothetical protein
MQLGYQKAISSQKVKKSEKGLDSGGKHHLLSTT